MSYCGPQYTGRGCMCYTQPTPGITPMTGLPSNGPLCGYIDANFLYACDDGCCPGGCPTVSSSSSSSGAVTQSVNNSALNILLLIMAILYCILLVTGVVWASRKKIGQ